MAILDVLKPRRPGDPVVITVSCSELNTKGGQLRKEIELGAQIRLVDGRTRRTVGWLTADPIALGHWLERQESE